MNLNPQMIRELAAKAVCHPYTGDEYLDAQLRDYAKLVGHDNPYYKLWWLLSKELQPDTVVELGAYRGNGAASWAAGNASSLVATVDIHREDQDARRRCEAIANHYLNLFYIHGWTWDDAVRDDIEMNFSPIEVLIIDAWHEYQYVVREWDLYEPLLADEALVICDDIFDSVGTTVDMERFWRELPGHDKFLDTDIHSGVPVGFMRYVRGQG